MAKIMEASFNVIYLVTVTLMGIYLISKGSSNKENLLFGIMAIVLGGGDAFHLIPRTIALLTTGLENYTVALGIGKMITSVTMTLFYILLYYVWRLRYKITGQKGLTIAFYVLAFLRIALCFFPQNLWTSVNPPLSWAIYRNIPFALMGILIIVLFYQKAKETNDKIYNLMWLTIVLSFGFYIPVVLWAQDIPLLGMLMIPKTLSYVWTVYIGIRSAKAMDRS